MKEKTNNSRIYYLITGLVLILFSISFFSLRFESVFSRKHESKIKLLKAEIKREYNQADFNRLKKDIEDLNLEVDKVADQISKHIYNASFINDSIVRLINQAAANTKLLDSLRFLEDALNLNETSVDSLNSIFEDKSTKLLDLMNSYNKQELVISLRNVDLESLKKQKWQLEILLYVYVSLFLIGFLLGLFFLIKGLLS